MFLFKKNQLTSIRTYAVSYDIDLCERGTQVASMKSRNNVKPLARKDKKLCFHFPNRICLHQTAIFKNFNITTPKSRRRPTGFINTSSPAHTFCCYCCCPSFYIKACFIIARRRILCNLTIM